MRHLQSDIFDPRLKSWRFVLFLCAFALILPLESMAAKRKPAEHAPIVWPSPPQEARIAFVQTMAEPADFGFKTSGFKRFANWLTGSQQGNEKLIKPFGIALDEADNLCLTDTGANAVYFFDIEKKRRYRWEKIEKMNFVSPVAVAKRKDTLFVADSALGSVFAFNLKGKLSFGIHTGLERPAGLALSKDRLFVADSQLHSVFIFDLNGKPLSHFGKRGGGPGEFNFPTHLTVDSRDELLVTDSMNGRIQLFDLDGVYKGKIGRTGDSPGYFGRPKGVAVDSFGRVYVMDALFDNLQIFDRDGSFLLSVGEAGAQRGEFWLPNGIAITKDNRIFIADSYNQRLQVLKYVGEK